MAEAKRQVTFSPSEFGQVVNLAIRAGQDSGAGVAGAAEDPYTRAARALRARYADDPARCDAAIARFSALMHLFTRDRLGPWVRTSAGHADARDIHPAVVHVAARMRLKRNGRFPERRFIEALEEFARSELARSQPADDGNGS